MCGIFGYIGPQEAVGIALDGITTLEYRGYDSAGIAAISLDEQDILHEKQVGKVVRLTEILDAKIWQSRAAISHTRWATHGKPTKVNAHPHMDLKHECAVVHNGIIENYESIREMLEKRGLKFLSETDTEVIPQLIGYLYKGDLLKAVQRAVGLLKGAFAIAVLHKKHPQQVICAARESPLSIGIGKGEMFISSDSHAFLKYTRKAIYLRSTEVALVTASYVEVFDARLARVTKESEDLDMVQQEISKGDFQHFMLKEIYEQPQTVRYALLSRYSQEYGTAILQDLSISEEDLLKVQRVIILGCGTSYHAGLIGAAMIEERARIPVQVEIASEFRYKNPIVPENTLAIAISQSGETADTIAAIRELKEKGAKVIGICNVQGSTIAREVDSCLFLRAGPEISVASTKAFTSQLTLLSLVSLRLARSRSMSQKEGKDFIEALNFLPTQIKKVLDGQEMIENLASKYARLDNFFFLGRRFMYPTALEGALKLKEIAYVNANGYPAGEMKHGPIALINEETLTVAFTADSVTYSKMLSNLMEIKARGGKILCIATDGQKEVLKIADDVIFVPKTFDELAPLLSTVAAQLFAYHFAIKRGTEIDRPRNLAKSVTVE